ncbi:type II toxin-antitoxin system Phd/YefM family antitoxin [Lactiplantibacillus pentosus]|nr:type II toxin-antitoxin system Phd/YefM family antitoxin [Lactiplantibacillus pentosus]
MATTVINITDARKNLKKITDDVVTNDTTVIITKPHAKNVVVISEAEYRATQETLYLLDSKENRNALDKSLSQLNTADVKTLSADEWRKLNEEA